MHRSLSNHIEEQITTASTFVLRHMPIGLTPEQIYEDLIGDPKIAQAFADAVQYLPPNALNRRMHFETEEYGVLAFNVRLPPTEKYPTYLMPQFSTPLTRQSKLSQALALPLRVLRDWAMLAYVFSQLERDIDDVRALACIMPWMRELIAEWKDDHTFGDKLTKDMRQLKHEVDAILSERPPKRFPRLTEPLNIVCLSGKALFSQYRMLTSCTNPIVSPTIIDRANAIIPDWLNIHLTEVIDEWRAEELHNKELEYERMRLKGKH